MYRIIILLIAVYLIFSQNTVAQKVIIDFPSDHSNLWLIEKCDFEPAIIIQEGKYYLENKSDSIPIIAPAGLEYAFVFIDSDFSMLLSLDLAVYLRQPLSLNLKSLKELNLYLFPSKYANYPNPKEVVAKLTPTIQEWFPNTKVNIQVIMKKNPNHRKIMVKSIPGYLWTKNDGQKWTEGFPLYSKQNLPEVLQDKY